MATGSAPTSPRGRPLGPGGGPRLLQVLEVRRRLPSWPPGEWAARALLQRASSWHLPPEGPQVHGPRSQLCSERLHLLPPGRAPGGCPPLLLASVFLRSQQHLHASHPPGRARGRPRPQSEHRHGERGPPGQRWTRARPRELRAGQGPRRPLLEAGAALQKEFCRLDPRPLPRGSGQPPARQQLSPPGPPARKDPRLLPAGRCPPPAARCPSAPVGAQPRPRLPGHLAGPAPSPALPAGAAALGLDPGEPGGTPQPRRPPPAPASLRPRGGRRVGLESHLEASLGSVARRGPCPPRSWGPPPFPRVQVRAGAGRPGLRAQTSQRSW